MTNLDTDAADVHGLITSILVKTGFRPFGSDGSTWEHPDGTKVSTGYSGGLIRLRRFVPGNDRFDRIPPIVWDINSMPAEDDVAEFVGIRRPAPPLSEDELIRLAEFEVAGDAPESFRERLIVALADAMNDLGVSPGRYYAGALADAALAVIRGEK